MLLQTCCPDGAEEHFAGWRRKSPVSLVLLGDEGHQCQSTLSLHLTVLSRRWLASLS
jgi:hypothetical protein